MSLVRFTTAHEVFDSFPTAVDDIEAAPSDVAPLEYLQQLAAGPTPNDAIVFCAYLLPRRAAVWWACRCLRILIPNRTDDEDAALQIAEAWVEEPEEPRRRAALRLGTDGDQAAPTTWAALSAGWSGGSLTVDDSATVPSPSHLTAKSASAAVMLALGRVPFTDRRRQLRACIDTGLRIARGEGR
jgi:hypothetical protein